MNKKTYALITGVVFTVLIAGSITAGGITNAAAHDPTSSDGAVHETATYEVVITNITPGQPLTPPLLVTHAAGVDIFTVGEEASYELKQLAENGNSGPLMDSLSGVDGVFDVVAGDAPLVPANDPGSTGIGHAATYTITARSHHEYLSFASMLICTNDGFVGLDGIALPRHGEETVYGVAYDARTEANTEDFADMVPPCQAMIGISSEDGGTGASDSAVSENGVVIPHPGIAGGADLTFAHAWTDPVVKVTITLVE